jgi:AraC-like DNA-binding protein
MISPMADNSGMNPICLALAMDPGLVVESGGVLISPGSGAHPRRTLASWELIVVERGRLGLAVGEHAHDLGPGDWVLMPAGTSHAGTTPYPRDLRFLWLHFHPRACAPAAATVELAPSGHLADAGGVLSLLRRCIDHQATLGSDALVVGMLLGLALAELRAGSRPAGAGDDLAARALRIIQARFREPLSTRTVARLLGVSGDHLGRCFQRAYGHAPMDAINHQRLREAERLLLLGVGAIDDVARSAGFRQSQWFRRLFQRRHGIGPRAWRRLHVRVHTNTA